MTDRDGKKKKHELESLGYCSPTLERENNTNDPFWNSPQHQARLQPAASVRVATIDHDSEDEFDYGSVTYDEDADDSDYTG